MVDPTTLQMPMVSAPDELRLAHAGEGVGRLAGLADGDDQGVRLEHRVRVAELRAEGDLRRDPREVLQEVLPDQARRSTTCRRPRCGSACTLRRSASPTPPSFAVPSERTILPRNALWMDSGCSAISLSMKWGKPPRSMSGRLKATCWTCLLTGAPSRVRVSNPSRMEDRRLPVVEVDHVPRVSHQRRRVACHERAVLADARTMGLPCRATYTVSGLPAHRAAIP